MSYGKDELFATHDAAPTSRAKYIKTFIIAAVIGALIVALVLYFSQARTGDAVRAPVGLEDAVKSYFLKNEKLDVTEQKTFLCKDAYGIEVWVTPATSSTAGKVKKTAIAISREGDSTWEVKPNETDPANGICGLYQ